MNGYLTDLELDAAILKQLFPEQQKTSVQLSVDIQGSGGAIRTGIRCEDLLERRLIFLAYSGSVAPYFRLTVRGKWEVQKVNGEAPVASVKTGGC